MVKVVGKSDEHVHRVTCRNCSSILEYTNRDVEYHKTNYDYTGSYDVVRGLFCPSCSKLVEIKQ